MKKVFSILFVAVLLIGTALDVQAQKKKGDGDNSSANGSNESLLIGKWKIDVDFLKKTVKKSERPIVVALLGSMTVEYKKDGEMETFAMDEVEKGSWYLTNGGKTLVQKSNKDGKEKKSKIIKLTDSKLLIESIDDDGDKMRLQFIK